MIDDEIKSSFREIIKPVNQRRAVYYILVQQTNYINKMLSRGEVEDKQAGFLLKELESKIASLKTTSIKVEPLKISDCVYESQDLREIFGEAFVRALPQQFVETKFGAYTSIASKGSYGTHVYVVIRGNLVESQHHIDEEREVESGDKDRKDLPRLLRPEGSICCTQNLMPQFSTSTITNLYTMKTQLSGLVALDAGLLAAHLKADKDAK